MYNISYVVVVADAPGPLHYGVRCDGCDGEVRGIRYKCLNCPDYDLCNKCKATGMHSEHEMVTINHPLPEVSFFLSAEIV